VVGTPVIIAPLWGVVKQIRVGAVWQRVRIYGGRAILIGVVCILIIGTSIAFSEVPAAHATEQQRMDLIAEMQKLGVTRFYTDYWTCNDLIIASQRQLICVSMDENLIAHDNRYAPYETIVDKTENTSWLCPERRDLTTWNYYCLPALEDVMNNEPPGTFSRYNIDGYVLYKNMQPEKPYPNVQLPTP
jgi:hypothetical protein